MKDLLMAKMGDEIPEGAVELSPRELVEMIEKRVHPVYVSAPDIQSFLSQCSVSQVYLRHLAECNGGCRKRLMEVAIDSLVEKGMSLARLAVEHDTADPPDDYWDGKEMPLGPEQQTLYPYGQIDPHVIAGLVRRLTLFHILCETIQNCPSENAASRSAIVAASLCGRFWHIAHQMLEYALKNGPLDPDEFLMAMESARLLSRASADRKGHNDSFWGHQTAKDMVH